MSPIDLEQAPLSELIALEEEKLADVMARAHSSGLYYKRWRRAGIKSEEVQKVTDLARLPFTTGNDVTRAYRDQGMDRVICSEVEVWFSTGDSSGAPIWIPYGKQDVLLALEHLARLCRVVGIGDGDILLIVTRPAPSPSDALPYFAAYAHKLKTGLSVEIIPVSLEMLELKPNLIELCQQRQPTVLCATPSGALKLAQIASQSLLHGVRLGLFYGEPLAPCRELLLNAYELEPYEVYGVAKSFHFNVECQDQDGIHIWLDACIPEIIPQVELDREKADPGYKPSAVLLTEAEPGLVGEYVATTFSQALPLIRFRTGDIVQVVGTEQCRCGRTHPRIRVV